MNFDVGKWLQNRGYQSVSAEHRNHMQLWADWYKGLVTSFHNYTIFNGVSTVSKVKKTLRFAKFVCEDWANLLLNEHVQITVADEFQEQLDDALARNQWCVRGNRLVEQAFALGCGALVEWIGLDKQPVIDYIRADMIYPLSWRGTQITECAFCGIQMVNGEESVYLMLHRLENGAYVIENHLFRNSDGQEMTLPEGVLPEVRTGSTAPLFQIIMPNIENNIEADCPMGISVFANSLSVLETLDDAFDSLDNEFVLGRKRITIPSTMARIQMTDQRDKDGKPLVRPVFDPRDAVFYALETKEEQKPQEFNMALRIQEHTEGIQSTLALIGKKVGVGVDRYTWDKQGGLKTATEVVSDKSDLFQNKCKHQHILEAGIRGMVQALAFLLDFNGDIECKVAFDDSIVQDAQGERREAREEVSTGVRSRLSYLMDVRHLSEEDALKELDRIQKETKVDMSAVDAFLTGAEQ